MVGSQTSLCSLIELTVNRGQAVSVWLVAFVCVGGRVCFACGCVCLGVLCVCVCLCVYECARVYVCVCVCGGVCLCVYRVCVVCCVWCVWCAWFVCGVIVCVCVL